MLKLLGAIGKYLRSAGRNSLLKRSFRAVFRINEVKTHANISGNPIRHLVDDGAVRKVDLLGEQRYCAVDLVSMLAGAEHAEEAWNAIKRSEHFGKSRLVEAQFGDQWVSMLTMVEVMRLIQSLQSPKAQRLRGWLANVGARHVAEDDDPELAVQRMRQSYAAAGRPRAWIDQRLRSVSARLDLVREWNKRGIHDSEQYRALTNAMTEAIFGVNVNTFRRNRRVRQNLRDYLTDMELSLISLAETVAANLHRSRNSLGMDQLVRDVEEAGRIASETRRGIDEVAAEVRPAEKSVGVRQDVA